MKNDIPRLASIAVVGVGVSVALLSVFAERPPARPVLPADYQTYTSRALREHFPNVPLVTQDKKTVRFYDDVIKDRVLIIQFMFTNCEQFCPMVTPNLARVQKELQKRAAGIFRDLIEPFAVSDAGVVNLRALSGRAFTRELRDGLGERRGRRLGCIGRR